MPYRQFFTLFSFFLSTALLTGQVTTRSENFPDRQQAATAVSRSALEVFKSEFSPRESAILHVYIDPDIDPEEVYLFRGQEASGTTVALLPHKFQRMAKRTGAKLYATGAIKLYGSDDHYLVRMDSPGEDRIELFRIAGSEVVHVKTLSYRNCQNGKCAQLDTWITDIDGDTDAELIQLLRTRKDGVTKARKERVYTFTDANRWKKSRILAEDAPWSTVEFYEEGQ